MKAGDLVLWLAPFASFTSCGLIFAALFGDALLTLSPHYTNKTDLPIVTVGFRQSCVRNNSAAIRLNCTNIASGNYRLEVVPDLTTRSLLTPTAGFFTVLIGISAGSSLLFFVIWLGFANRFPLQKVELPPNSDVDPIWVDRRLRFLEFLFEYLPFVTLICGLLPFLTVYMSFCHIRDDFNDYSGQFGRVEYIASTGNGFLCAWAGYALCFLTTIVFWMHACVENPAHVRHGSLISRFKRRRPPKYMCCVPDKDWSLQWGIYSRGQLQKKFNELRDDTIRITREEFAHAVPMGLRPYFHYFPSYFVDEMRKRGINMSGIELMSDIEWIFLFFLINHLPDPQLEHVNTEVQRARNIRERIRAARAGRRT